MGEAYMQHSEIPLILTSGMQKYLYNLTLVSQN
jgi:hypothetical protein